MTQACRCCCRPVGTAFWEKHPLARCPCCWRAILTLDSGLGPGAPKYTKPLLGHTSPLERPCQQSLPTIFRADGSRRAPGTPPSMHSLITWAALVWDCMNILCPDLARILHRTQTLFTKKLSPQTLLPSAAPGRKLLGCPHHVAICGPTCCAWRPGHFSTCSSQWVWPQASHLPGATPQWACPLLHLPLPSCILPSKKPLLCLNHYCWTNSMIAEVFFLSDPAPETLSLLLEASCLSRFLPLGCDRTAA